MQMTHEQPNVTAKSGGRSALAISSAVMTVLVLIQAILAGRGWFINHTFIDIHAGVADLVVLVAIAQAVFAFRAVRRQQSGRSLLWMSLAILVLVIVQVGLGYGGKDSGTAASIHVPNGVLIFGLSVATTVLSWGRGRTA